MLKIFDKVPKTFVRGFTIVCKSGKNMKLGENIFKL